MLTSNQNKSRYAKKRSRIAAKTVFSNPWCFLGYGFGIGLVPFAPGTFGTLVAVPLFLLVSGLRLEHYVLLTLALFAIGVFVCSVSERLSHTQDDSGIVWDEMVGFLVTMTFSQPTFPTVVLGFVYFRFFDIIKPWPIRTLDKKIHGGFGVMIDDVLAGLFAAIALGITSHIFNLRQLGVS